MKMIHRLSVCILSALLLGCFLSVPAHAGTQGKKALLIVAKDDFEQSEYKKTRGALEDAGVVCTVTSTKSGKLRSNKGMRIDCDMLLTDVVTADYDAVIVIGGNGIKKVWKNSDAHRILKEAAAQGKLIGGICAGPGLLAHAGVLDGKKATAHPKSGAKYVMKDHGCDYQRDSVVVDGNVITANGPKAASKFGAALVKALN